MTVDGRRITAQERLLENRYGRLRDVVSGLTGSCTSARATATAGRPVAEDDRLLRMVPVTERVG